MNEIRQKKQPNAFAYYAYGYLAFVLFIATEWALCFVGLKVVFALPSEATVVRYCGGLILGLYEILLFAAAVAYYLATLFYSARFWYKWWRVRADESGYVPPPSLDY